MDKGLRKYHYVKDLGVKRSSWIIPVDPTSDDNGPEHRKAERPETGHTSPDGPAPLGVGGGREDPS